MITVEEVTRVADMEACYAIRMAVFVDEQKVPAEEEIDALDTSPETIHLVVKSEGQAVGTARILPEGPGHCHIGRVALLPAARGTGAGKLLMERACELSLERCGESLPDGGVAVRVELSAQERVVGFYEACGFSLLEGDHYLDAGIWHRDMVREIRG